jgi:hypothetical protein
LWFGADALIWWTSRQPLSVPVVTTGPASQPVNPGGLGVPGTVSLNQTLNYGVTGGVQLYAGGWFNTAHTWGIDTSVLVLGTPSSGFTVSDPSGTGAAVINMPVAGAPFSTLVSAPGVDTGSVSVTTWSQFGGVDVNLLYNLVRGGGWTINLLGGFRYYELDEKLNIASSSTLFTTTTYTDGFGNTLAVAPPGSGVTTFDQFRTRNQFYGGQVGAYFQYQSEQRWFVSGWGKLAIGGTQQIVDVNGFTNVFPTNAQPVALSGGNFATSQQSHYVTNHFAIAPSFQLNVGYQFTPFVRGSIGYSFVFLSNVLRPGNQIDNTFDGNLHPLVPFVNSGFWMQGLNLSIQCSF